MEIDEIRRKETIGFAMVLFVVLGLSVAIALQGTTGTGIDLTDPDTINFLKFAQLFTVVLLFVTPTLLIAAFGTGEKIGWLRMNKKPRFMTILLAALLILVAQPLIDALGVFNEGMTLPGSMAGIENWMKEAEIQAHELTEAILVMDGVGDLIINIVVIAIAAAVSEEMFFRGLLQRFLVKFTRNIHIGVWLAAIIFSGLHGQFYGFLPRMLIGAMLGYLFVWSGSLWVPITVHLVNNGMSVFVYYLMQRDILPPEFETAGVESEYGTVLVIISVILSAGLLFLIWKKSDKADYLAEEVYVE